MDIFTALGKLRDHCKVISFSVPSNYKVFIIMCLMNIDISQKFLI